MPINYSSITKLDKEFYQRNIDKYLSYLINPNSIKNQNDQFKIEIDYKMKIQNLEIKSLNERENQELKEFLEATLKNMFINLNFENPDELGLTFKDYINYVLCQKPQLNK